MDADDLEHQETPPADLLRELAWKALETIVFRAALELRVWDTFASGPKSAQQTAKENNWDIEGTLRILDALCVMKLLDKNSSEYHLVPIAESYLISGTPGYMGEFFLGELNWEGNGQLADGIRTGTRPIVNDWISGGLSAFWASDVAPSRLRPEKAMEGKDEIWRLLNIHAREGMRVLDVACGPATMTFALARQNPGLSLTLNDWPAVVESAMVVAEKLGIKPQVTSLPGDIHTVDFGKGQYDLIWIGDFLHFWGPEQIVKILKKLHQALDSGGVLVVKEVAVVDEDRRKNVLLLASLWLFAVSTEGNFYTPSEWIGFLKQAGFPDPIAVSKEGELPFWYKASKQ